MCTGTAKSKRACCRMLRDLLSASGTAVSDAHLHRVYVACRHCYKRCRVRVRHSFVVSPPPHTHTTHAALPSRRNTRLKFWVFLCRCFFQSPSYILISTITADYVSSLFTQILSSTCNSTPSCFQETAPAPTCMM